MTKGCRLASSSSLHSKWIGTSLTRGAAILTLGIGVRPVSANSESPAAKALAESTISLHTGFRHHVEAEFASLAHVLERMLLGAVGIAHDCQRDHRRNDADHGEKGKRREISDTALAYCRCPANRPRHYSP